MAELSPMMKQYTNIKKQYQDEILFYRLGDFYEMFFDDAIKASKELELTLTGRDCGQEEKAPMCGVPYHSYEAYVKRLVEKGYKVAICEQVEDPAKCKGIVKREVVRVITPGTIIETSMLDETSNNFLCCIYLNEKKKAGVCFADISTGQIYITELVDKNIQNRLMNEIGRFTPSEIIFNPRVLKCKKLTDFIKVTLNCTVDYYEEEDFALEPNTREVLNHFKKPLPDIGLDDKDTAIQCLGVLLSYVSKTQMSGLERLHTVNFYNDNQFMNLDLVARRNLELTETMRSKEKKGSLLWVLDRTKTAMGKRLIKTYLEQPLLNPALINNRLNAVQVLYQENVLLQSLTELLTHVFDMERLMTKIVYGNANAREVRALAFTSRVLPQIKQSIEGIDTIMLREIYQNIDTLEDIHDMIENAIVDDPPVNLKDGHVIRTGYNRELDELRDIVRHSKQYLTNLESSEKEKTGIKNLKIGYNKVFGYYIEVTKSNLPLVPKAYIRKQTLANCERYITEELKELESKILGANEKIVLLEQDLFEQIRKEIAAQLYRIQLTAQAVAKLDVLCSFASVSVKQGYCCPTITLGDEIIIKDGRHPVVEAVQSGSLFVANDTDLNCADRQIAVITGPNMAGKSTYMRQVALITLMAQIGCFVPAKSAQIGIVDGIYTRVGASDDLASGQSTFMVEMNEVANILRNATRKSLLILDEIGRGTSTFDGMSIARAILEYIADSKKLGAKTLFATHYHELTELEEMFDCIKNYNIAVKKRGDDIIFLRRIIPGGTDDSYGIEVSKLAGIPNEVVKRAYEILDNLENGIGINLPKNVKVKKREYNPDQFIIQNPQDNEVIKRLGEIDTNVLSPLEALNILHELKLISGKKDG
ncbi:DNA mismatch repair protein MutS [Candidatus Soleaferrea massiliensis]|uniref:DNA mismatch repair protein MutS n=1 Tax=Candidatus Soleaferrea massiliensis TaxID=1470354 RepID=UPI00058C2DDD|nr:DNA mismatch repair protein MutS [Candidatus Soleaferrea massiliensis]